MVIIYLQSARCVGILATNTRSPLQPARVNLSGTTFHAFVVWGNGMNQLAMAGRLSLKMNDLVFAIMLQVEHVMDGMHNHGMCQECANQFTRFCLHGTANSVYPVFTPIRRLSEY